MGRGYYILDENSQPAAVDDFLVWARWFEEHDRHVAETMVNAVRRPSFLASITISPTVRRSSGKR